MSASQLVARLAQANIDPALLADVAQELFAAEIERKALADRRQNERERKARSRDSTGQNVTGRERRGPPKENKSKPQLSEPNGSGGPAADPAKAVWDLGVEILTSSGCTEKQARSLIGKWRKATGKDGEVLSGLIECRAKSISEPVEWLTKRFDPPGYVSASGYRYRGDDRAVMREAEKRADWGTYWKAKGNLDGDRQAANG